jgi:RNA polymerase sigma-70 factor (ECF subfamily)
MNRLDQQLVGNCLQGNEAAWEEFVRRHSRRIYNLSCRFVRCRAEAEDLTQDVFVRAYQTLKSYRGEAGSLNGWIMRVALNLLIDRYRKTRKEAQLHPIEEEERTLNDPHATNPLQRLARNETKTEVRNALRRLPSNSRIVIELHDLEGLALKEVAAHLHIPEGTVKSRMIRGRRALARIMRNSERRPAEIGHRLDRRWCRYMSFHEAFPAIGISTPVTFGAEGAGE